MYAFEKGPVLLVYSKIKGESPGISALNLRSARPLCDFSTGCLGLLL